MVTTMTGAAKALGMTRQALWLKVQEGVVSARKEGGVVLIDPEQARQELTVTGYFYHKAKYRRTQAARIAAAEGGKDDSELSR